MTDDILDAIVIEHLSKSYGSNWVVRDLNLRVPTGCVYGFLGCNGAGKSTTIKMSTGMTPPDCGRISLLGESTDNLTPRTRSRIAYMVEGHPLYSWMTIGQMLQFTRSFYEFGWFVWIGYCCVRPLPARLPGGRWMPSQPEPNRPIGTEVFA
jgi:ABC-2 type transport system ATP-binding protein